MNRLLPAGALLLGPIACFAQASVATSCLADPDDPLPQPVISVAFAPQFAAIRECIENEAAQCAEAGLDAIDDETSVVLETID